jgi:polyphosphate glucokinase
MQDKLILGVDVGGSGIKAALVNVITGELQQERIRLETPQPATPKAMTATFAELIKLHNYKGVIGCGFPAIVKGGVVQSAANISKKWIGENVIEHFSLASNCPVEALNDADAAGLAEVKFGVGKGQAGVTVLITIGTGLGSALFVDGRLVPNSELGHIQMHGMIAEAYASNNARKREGMEWEEWGKRFNEYLHYLCRVINPDLILLGGGGSKRFERYESCLDVDAIVKPAGLLNSAGIIGAATHAYLKMRG